MNPEVKEKSNSRFGIRQPLTKQRWKQPREGTMWKINVMHYEGRFTEGKEDLWCGLRMRSCRGPDLCWGLGSHFFQLYYTKATVSNFADNLSSWGWASLPFKLHLSKHLDNITKYIVILPMKMHCSNLSKISHINLLTYSRLSMNK